MNIINHGIFNLIDEGDRACLDFNPEGDRYPKDLVDSSFRRECRYLLRFQNYKWAPKRVYVEIAKRKLYFDWSGNTCEDYVPTNFAEQLENITRDLHKEKVYKPSFYPKYFFADKDDNLIAYGFYSSSDYKEQPINIDFYRPILNPQRRLLVEQIEVDGKLDMGILVRHAFTNYIKWPNDPLPKIYNNVYCQNLETSEE